MKFSNNEIRLKCHLFYHKNNHYFSFFYLDEIVDDESNDRWLMERNARDFQMTIEVFIDFLREKKWKKNELFVSWQQPTEQEQEK